MTTSLSLTCLARLNMGQSHDRHPQYRFALSLDAGDFRRRVLAALRCDALGGDVMASVKDSLIAAKALIDTPEKWDAKGKSSSRAIYDATGGWEEYFAAEQAYAAIRLRGVGYQNVLNTFDRAIAAQDSRHD